MNTKKINSKQKNENQFIYIKKNDRSGIKKICNFMDHSRIKK